jgi:hypothetical protein
LTFVDKLGKVVLSTKGGVILSDKKMGRPTNNPKPIKLTVRVDDEALMVLDKYCEVKGISRADGVRAGIKKLNDDIKK